MKFEQLLKIICKRYFFLFFIIPLLHPLRLLVCWTSVEQWYRPQCKEKHRAAMMLIMFPKHIWGPYPHCRSWVFILFCFHIVLLALKLLWWYLRHGKIGVCCWIQAVPGEKKNLCHVRCSNIHWNCLLKGILGTMSQGICCVSNIKHKYCDSAALMYVFFWLASFSSWVFSGLFFHSSSPSAGC